MKRKVARYRATPRRSSSCTHSLLVVISLYILAILLLSLVGCSQKQSLEASANSSEISSGKQYSILVLFNDRQIAPLNLDDLSRLEQVTFSAEGKEQRGPTLLSALKLNGISGFKEIKVVGYARGRVASSELTLKSGQVNDKVILAISKQGTAKLVSPDIPSKDWVIDVSKLEVK